MPTITITTIDVLLAVDPQNLEITAGEAVQWMNQTSADCTVSHSGLMMLVLAGKTSSSLIVSVGTVKYQVNATGLTSCSGSITVSAIPAAETIASGPRAKQISISKEGDKIHVHPHRCKVAVMGYFRWKNDSREEMTVNFPDVKLPLGPGAQSDMFCSSEEKRLSYTVTDTSCNTIDPEIIIQSGLSAHP